MTECVTKEQKAALYRRLCETGLTTAQIEQERTAIVRRLKAAGMPDRAKRQRRMWQELAARHLGCDLDGQPLPDGTEQAPESQTEPMPTASPAFVPLGPFRMSRDAVADALEAGSGREVSLGERYDWVAQNLDNPDASPANGPDNAAWSLLLWAQGNRKDFFSNQRQYAQSRKEPTDVRADEEEQRDLEKMFNLVDAFGCWREAELRESTPLALEDGAGI